MQDLLQQRKQIAIVQYRIQLAVIPGLIGPVVYAITAKVEGTEVRWLVTVEL